MILVTLTGPSSSGKTTILNEMVKSGKYASMVSHTTRNPRPGEKEGIDYFFVSDADFLAKKAEGGFIESVEFNGFRYGISLDQLEAVSSQNKVAVLIVEPKGLHQIDDFCKEKGISTVACYIGGTLENLISRYLHRADHYDFTDTELCDEHALRLKSLVEEVSTWSTAFPYEVYITESTPQTLQSDVQFISTTIDIWRKDG